MSAADTVLHAVDRDERGEVHRITVNRPAKLNTLDSATTEALGAALVRAGERDGARLVVLAGSGERAWIGGADIHEMAALDGEAAALAFIRRLHRVCRTLRELPVPVIAAIRGWCLGAGLELAACCDLRLAAADSRYGMPEVRVGLPSVIEAAVLPRLIGIGRARDLVLTGRVVEAEEALRWGLLDSLVEGEALDELVQARAREILDGAPGAIRAQKRLCRAWEELPLPEAIEAGIDAFGESFRSAEPREYLMRFVERRRTRS